MDNLLLDPSDGNVEAGMMPDANLHKVLCVCEDSEEDSKPHASKQTGGWNHSDHEIPSIVEKQQLELATISHISSQFILCWNYSFKNYLIGDEVCKIRN